MNRTHSSTEHASLLPSVKETKTPQNIPTQCRCIHSKDEDQMYISAGTFYTQYTFYSGNWVYHSDVDISRYITQFSSNFLKQMHSLKWKYAGTTSIQWSSSWTIESNLIPGWIYDGWLMYVLETVGNLHERFEYFCWLFKKSAYCIHININIRGSSIEYWWRCWLLPGGDYLWCSQSEWVEKIVVKMFSSPQILTRCLT